MSLYIRKHPSPTTLLARAYADTAPDGYEASTEDAAAAWVAAQIAEGWEPQHPPETPPPLPVPESIGPAQLRIALRRLHGIEATTVDATIAAVIAYIPDADARAEAQIYATAATSYLRHHPLVGAIAAALGLTPAETDAVFRLGATL